MRSKAEMKFNCIYEEPLDFIDIDYTRLNKTIRYEQRPRGEWKEYNVSTFRGMDEWGEPKWGKGKKFICKRCLRVTVIRENFCPKCGADMRVKTDFI